MAVLLLINITDNKETHGTFAATDAQTCYSVFYFLLLMNECIFWPNEVVFLLYNFPWKIFDKIAKADFSRIIIF